MTDPMSQGFSCIEQTLQQLCQEAAQIDYKAMDQRQLFLARIVALKQQLGAVEEQLTQRPAELVEFPVLHLHLNHQIRPLHMEGWLRKVHTNIVKQQALPNLSTADQITFIHIQYRLLDVIVKILNGDAYFSGFPQ